jgi:glycosyltransferase involved in cell wall biosynthesis
MSARDYGSFCSVRNLLYYRGTICTGPAPLKCARCAAFTYAQDEAGNAVLGRRDASVTDRHRLRGAGKSLAAVTAVLGGRRLLARRLDGLHANSTFVQGAVRQHLLDASGRGRRPLAVEEVIPSFLPPAANGTGEASLPHGLPDEPYILFVGALLPQKGVWPLLEAYAGLRRPAPPLVLLGPSFHNSPSRFPPGVRVLGSVPQASVLAAWRHALFGVVPSVAAETFGNVITEAMSQGRPVVASRVGGITDIISDGEDGLLVPPADVATLRAAMQRLIDEPRWRERLGARARESSVRFRLEAVLPAFDALYQRMLADRPSRS